jgi:hypothetical protein
MVTSHHAWGAWGGTGHALVYDSYSLGLEHILVSL